MQFRHAVQKVQAAEDVQDSWNKLKCTSEVVEANLNVVARCCKYTHDGPEAVSLCAAKLIWMWDEVMIHLNRGRISRV